MHSFRRPSTRACITRLKHKEDAEDSLLWAHAEVMHWMPKLRAGRGYPGPWHFTPTS